VDRYQQIIKRLDSIPKQNLRICPGRNVKGYICACGGCAGIVGAKAITERELDMYINGELQEIAND